jgi:hypothetical protein
VYSVTIAFTLSSSFSGSTLLSFLLNAHPQIATISETDPLGNIRRNDKFMCSCGMPIRNCAFFQGVARTMASKGFPFSVEDMELSVTIHPNHRINALLTGALPFVSSATLERVRDRLVRNVPVMRRRLEKIYVRNVAFMETVLDIAGANVYLDANKDPYRMRFFQRHGDVRVVYLFKNGIAGVYSYIKNTQHTLRLDVEAASHRWFREQLAINRALTSVPESSVAHVSYEDLCNDVTGTLRRIHATLGVRVMDATHPNEAEHHIVGNSMRLTRIDEISERRDWMHALSESQVEVYRSIYDQYIDRIRRANPYLADRIWH